MCLCLVGGLQKFLIHFVARRCVVLWPITWHPSSATRIVRTTLNFNPRLKSAMETMQTDMVNAMNQGLRALTDHMTTQIKEILQVVRVPFSFPILTMSIHRIL
jgi:hypothetical protein